MRLFAVLICLLLPTPVLFADASVQDWFGTYSINQDGHIATLAINGVKCGRRPNCQPFFMRYTDDQNIAYSVVPGVLDDSGQHLPFTVQFPSKPQTFDLYLFSFDKTRLAGTTVWGGRTFGVQAVKTSSTPGAPSTQPAQAQTAGSGLVSVDRQGTITVHKADGSVLTKRAGDCSWTAAYPDGHTKKLPCANVLAVDVQILAPPAPPSSGQSSWFNAMDAQSLSIIQAILGGAQSASYQNYLSTHEDPNADIYTKVSNRLAYLDQLAPYLN